MSSQLKQPSVSRRPTTSLIESGPGAFGDLVTAEMHPIVQADFAYGGVVVSVREGARVRVTVKDSLGGLHKHFGKRATVKPGKNVGRGSVLGRL